MEAREDLLRLAYSFCPTSFIHRKIRTKNTVNIHILYCTCCMSHETCVSHAII